MPCSWLVGGSRPQSWIRLRRITTRGARPYCSLPTAKQIAVWWFVTSLPMKAMLSPCTVGLGFSEPPPSLGAAEPSNVMFWNVTYELLLSVMRRPRNVARSPG